MATNVPPPQYIDELSPSKMPPQSHLFDGVSYCGGFVSLTFVTRNCIWKLAHILEGGDSLSQTSTGWHSNMALFIWKQPSLCIQYEVYIVKTERHVGRSVNEQAHLPPLSRHSRGPTFHAEAPRLHPRHSQISSGNPEIPPLQSPNLVRGRIVG